MADVHHQLDVGIVEFDGGGEHVAVDFHQPVRQVSFPPEFAVHFAQVLLKNARLAGYTAPFVELPLRATQIN